LACTHISIYKLAQNYGADFTMLLCLPPSFFLSIEASDDHS